MLSNQQLKLLITVNNLISLIFISFKQALTLKRVSALKFKFTNIKFLIVLSKFAAMTITCIMMIL